MSDKDAGHAIDPWDIRLSGRTEPNPLRRQTSDFAWDPFDHYPDGATRTGRAPNPDGPSWRAEDAQ